MPGGGFQNALFLSEFGFDAHGSMRNRAQPFFGNQLSGYLAYAVGAVFHAHHGSFEVVDELLEPSGELGQVFLFKGICTVVERKVVVVGTVGAVLVAVAELFLQGIEFFPGNIQLLVDQLAELLQVFFCVTCFLCASPMEHYLSSVTV
jgi:hypothetical protein